MDVTVSTALLHVDNACMIYLVISKMDLVPMDVNFIFKPHCVKVRYSRKISVNGLEKNLKKTLNGNVSKQKPMQCK